MDKNNLRQEYGNETGDKIRVEMFVTYNNNYVKWLEEKLVKLLTIPDVSNRSKLLIAFMIYLEKDKYNLQTYLEKIDEFISNL